MVLPCAGREVGNLLRSSLTRIAHARAVQGQILSHEEIWRNKSVPLPKFMKPFVGSSTALFMRLLGWGKDVAPPAHPKST